MMNKRVLRALSMVLALLMLLTTSGVAEILRPDSKGAAVVRLQQALAQLGYYTGDIDGVYGDGTEAAVRSFQQNFGLIADGKAGSATQYQIKLLTGIEVSDIANPGASTGTTGGDSGDVVVNPNGLFGGNYSKLVFGATSSRVRILQNALKALGFEISKVDGVFGTSTYKAVKEFQETVGLTVDGKAGPHTLKKLESYFDANGNCISGPIVTAPPAADDENLQYGIPQRTLRPGMSGLDVQYTQDRLKTLGYYTGTSDGQYGSGTEAAVKAFQKHNDLTVDGKVGANTSRVLFSDGALANGETAPANPGDRTLREGMEGDDVKAVQQRLTELGYYTRTIDGKYGSGTIAAMKAFQSRNGLKVDGVCGPNTILVLYSSTAIDAGSSITTPPDDFPLGKPTRILRPGYSGDDVKSVQYQLQLLGYYNGTIDGKYGSGTVAAVKYFQARNGLTVDGKVGSNTADKLYSDVAVPSDGLDGSATPAPTDQVTATPSRTLRLGSEGDDVILLQTRLLELGYLTGTVDGVFGSATGAAVAAFQLRNGLSADGVAGTKTYKKLFSSNAIAAANASTPTPSVSVPTVPQRVLYEGCTGEDVKLVQNRLKALGYLTGSVDGKYGPATAAAMSAFQEKNGLTVSGMGDTATYDVLFSLYAITAGGVQAGSSSTESYTTLRVGSTGNAVIRLQQMLSTLKYTVYVNGYYDETTRAAVLAFQKRNGLTADGVAGVATQTKLYSGDCVTGDTELPEEESGTGSIIGGSGFGPSASQVKLLMWYDDIKPTIKSGQVVLVYEPSSGSSFQLRLYSLGRHADSEPYTANDTAIMKAAWGGKFSWSEKPVYVRLPNGTWCLASMHSMPHLSGALDNNDFDGHLCVHFPRTMEETISSGDTKNGVRHQNDIRKHWKKLTGEDISW
ncbi:MAG: peptidoglycan-binding protein [Clostridia bacterium]|nr:peptidoglycan-binding protein [Clostridia bacterium]